jgi:eukaryotic-like serine/threonine-protein kinase
MGENAEGAAGSVAKGKETGRLLGGRYRLADVLGRGGMGTVWRARDEVLGRTVAVKELRFPSDIDEDDKRRLVTRTLREAKAIARIRSGSAVTVFDVVDEDDRPWIVMELVEGRSLADVIREDGPVTPRRAAEIGLAILDVLRAAHREGIVHRDVKPSNVLLEEDTGRVVLTDFGIAKVEGDPSVTSTGMLVGAPSYISPERARGHRPGSPADMWSLGGLLYAAVEGHPPYDKGSAIATLTAVMTDPLEPPARAGALSEVIYGLLLKDPEKRLDDAGARPLLEAVMAGPDEPEQAGEEPRSVTVTTALPTVALAEGLLPEEAPGPRRPKALAKPERTATVANAKGSGPAPKPGGEQIRALADLGGGTDIRRRPLGLVIAVVAAVLAAVIGVVVAFALNNGGDTGGDGGSSGTGESTAAAGGSGGDDGGTDDAAGGLPEEYERVSDDRFGFSMALPSGWERVSIAGRNSGGVYAARKGTLPKVQVDFSGSPKDDASAAWRRIEAAVAGASTDYRKLGIRSVGWRDYPTVSDWEFERGDGGERVHVLNRGFKVDSRHGYAIMITCRADEWDGDGCRTLRGTAFGTFEPAG